MPTWRREWSQCPMTRAASPQSSSRAPSRKPATRWPPEGYPLPRLTTERLSALLLIWALLLCHGVFGSLHLVPDPALQPTLPGEHATTHLPSHAHGVAAPGEHPPS